MTSPPTGAAGAAIAADPREALPQLHQLLASYFHQDWTVERESWTAVADDFIAESPRSVIVATTAELRRLLAAGLDETRLRWVLENLDCNLDPAGVGLDAQGWLAELLQRLDG